MLLNDRLELVGSAALVELLDAVRLDPSPRTCRATAGVSTGRVLTAAGVPLKIGCLTTPARFFSEALLVLGGL